MGLLGLKGRVSDGLSIAFRLPLVSLLARPPVTLAARAKAQDAAIAGGPFGISSDARLSDEAVGFGFRVLAVSTVASIFGLVILGGVVRLTESGLGCPDWPLCHGKVVPPLDGPTLIEYFHRLAASLVGLLVLVTVLIAWRHYKRRPWIVVPASLGLLLLVVQVLLGGVTVLEELSSKLVLAHLATAEALMAAMVVVCLVALQGSAHLSVAENGGATQDRFSILALAVAAAVFVLLLSGSYMTVSGAAVSCGQWWPLCQGQSLPEGYYQTVHMAHRGVALVVGLLIAWVVILAWRRRQGRPAVGGMALAVGVLFLGQILVGAMILWMGFPLATRLLHLAMATLVWVSLAALAVLAHTAPNGKLQVASHA